MVRSWNTSTTVAVTLLFALCLCTTHNTFSFTSTRSVSGVADATSSFCPYFGNRAPLEQTGLRNCTWFRNESCCLDSEIESLMGSVDPFPGQSDGCKWAMNYLACYVCSPEQALWYNRMDAKVRVCKSLCDEVFEACSGATYKGELLSDKFSSGTQFCQFHSYDVQTTQDENCYYRKEDHLLSAARGATLSAATAALVAVAAVAATTAML